MNNVSDPFGPNVRKVSSCIVLFIFSTLCCGCAAMSVDGRSATDVFHNTQVVALLNAAEHGNTIKAKALISGGADINAAGDAGITPLIWMIAEHDDEAIRLLLELGADPNKPWKQGESPVYMAASGGNIRLLNMLLDYHGNPNASAHENSAMMIAIMQLHFDCAKLLLKRGADINFHEGVSTSISAPMVVGRFDWAVWMLENGYNYGSLSIRVVAE